LIRKNNGGQSSGLNAAYRESTGEVICLLDSDDVYLERKLECVVQAFRHDIGAGMVAHKVYRVDAVRRRQGTIPMLSRVPSGWYGEQMLATGGILDDLPPGIGLSIRREVAQRIFPLPEQGILRDYGDTPIMRLAPLITVIQGLDQSLAEWRQHEGNHGNVRKFTVSHIDREVSSYFALWQCQRDYLVSRHPAVAGRLAGVDVSPHVAEMNYVRARLIGSGDAWELHRRLSNRLSRTSGPAARRLFWQWSIWLPKPAFLKLLAMIMTQGKIKQWISQWMRRLRSR